MVDTRYDHTGRKGVNVWVWVALIAIVIVGLLFATGFWSADVKEGDLPEVSVKGGELPKVDVDSKEVVVGTKKETIDVPTVDVKNNGED
ncbi:hypothetical protein [Novosphingobium sp.]|jgi:hypothetical protein|uniref:hypothetical protein n=1 Tax=Novosphingobium sp. TaxID=1874826 RepID=UPI0028ABF5BD|nr:hypothetical protein [Novosphingobium sp.]